MTSIANSVWENFCELKAANEFEGNGIPCGDKKQHLFVKGKDGEPVLFLKSEPRLHPRAPIRLMNVVGEFDRKYSLNSVGGAEAVTSFFTTFRCVPEAADLHPYFVEMMVAIAAVQPASLSEKRSTTSLPVWSSYSDLVVQQVSQLWLDCGGNYW